MLLRFKKTKSELRKKHLNFRNAMSRSEVLEKSAAICKHLLELKCVRNAETILMYYPLGNEVDLTSLYELFTLAGKQILLPYTEGGEIFLGVWCAEKELEVGEYGIMVPEVNKDEQRKLCELVDVVVVPGIVFDKRGNRVGFGKGYYDRFLVKTRHDCVKIAVCYNNQFIGGECKNESQLIDAEPQDVRMDYIVMENGVCSVGN